MKITIIIPVHNSEKYLRDCIESALTQTYKDIEVICVDDGSRDRSYEIIQELQNRDSRLVYINDSNSSYGHKVNVGIKEAKGKYIAILESDDKLSSNMIGQLCNIAVRHNVDIVDANYYEFVCYNDKEYFNIVNKYSNIEEYDRVLYFGDKPNKNIIENGIWTALYKREFLLQHKIRLNESEGASYQDTSFMFLTNLLAKSVYHLNVPLYQYRIDNAGSSVRNDKKIFEIVGEFEYLFHELDKRGISDEKTWKLYFERKYKTYYWNYKRLSDKSRKIFIEKYVDELKRDIKNGSIKQDLFGESLYKYTFFLIDDEKQFIESASQNKEKNFLRKTINILNKTENKDIVMFGAGAIGRRVFNILLQHENTIRAVCDNSLQLQGTFLKDFEIMPVQETVRRYPNAMFLVLNRKYYVEMRCQLLAEGIRDENIIIFE